MQNLSKFKDSGPSPRPAPLYEGAACFHCGLNTKNPILGTQDTGPQTFFCCNGCRSVYAILKESSLDDYYKIKESSEDSQSSPIIQSKDSFEHFDEDNFKSEYITVDQKSGVQEVKLYLEGIHCIACLWLIENSPKILKSIQSAALDFDNSVATFKLAPDALPSKLALTLNKLGYVPHPIKNNDEVRALKIKEERDYLVKIGIAMACMGNILLLSISIYGGLEGTLKHKFEWLSFIIALPVLFYSAIPFYKSSFAALRQKRINMDLPISIALIAGGIGGLYTLLSGVGELYFDTLTSLVFLLLLSRYVLLKIKLKGVSSSSLEYFSSFGSVDLIDESGISKGKVLSKYLNTGDLIRVNTGLMIPADGEVLKGAAHLNTSLLTGESAPIKCISGSKVFSGTQVISGELIIKVEKTAGATKLGSILSAVNNNSRYSKISTLSESISRYFVGLVLVLSICTLYYFYLQGDLAEGAMRALTLLIVTCPCALALATPLALTSAIQKLSRKGVIIKSEESLEKLAKAKDIFLDKTGTLTKGLFQVSSWEPTSNQEDWVNIVWSLELRGQHPIASAIRNYLESVAAPIELQMSEWKEVPGVGVEAAIEGRQYKISKYSSEDPLSTTIALYEDDVAVLKMQLQDSLRADSASAIIVIKKMGLTPYIISGDSKVNVENIAKLLEIGPSQTFSRVDPNQKLNIIKKRPLAIMVGDGANDAMALKEAEVGIAVKGSIDISLQAADIYLSSPGIRSILKTIIVSRQAFTVIKRNMAFSLIYNVLGAGLALYGIISPLWAAVLMPVSSLTVLFSTVMWSKKGEIR